jgi:hypothetical protein
MHTQTNVVLSCHEGGSHQRTRERVCVRGTRTKVGEAVCTWVGLGVCVCVYVSLSLCLCVYGRLGWADRVGKLLVDLLNHLLH